jgi:hypothetical protein
VKKQADHFIKGPMVGAAKFREMKAGHFLITPKNCDPEIGSAKISCEYQGG